MARITNRARAAGTIAKATGDMATATLTGTEMEKAIMIEATVAKRGTTIMTTVMATTMIS
jgi:hypothetical protein